MEGDSVINGIHQLFVLREVSMLVNQKSKNFSSIVEPFMESSYNQVIVSATVLTYAIHML